MDLIKEVQDSTVFFEAPRRYYYWATLAAISAVLKDRVWFNMGDNYNIYPNIYVLLYGPSGVRKGPAIALAETLVKRVNCTRVIDGRSSIEAVIKELGTFQTRPGQAATKDSCGFMVASELSSSIIGNSAAMDIMTNLYDRIYNEGEWNYRLKVGESSKLKKPTITWLSGTNEALFREFVPEKNLHGGLIGRMFVISEKAKHTTNSLMYLAPKTPDKEKLTILLGIISKMQGEFTMAAEVRAAVNEWYNKFDKEIAPGLHDDTGFVSRILDFVIKIGILLAAGRDQTKEISVDHIKEAMDVVLPLIVPTKRVVNAVKKNDATLVTKRGYVLTFITNQPDYKCERAKLLQGLQMQIDHEDLDKIAQYMIVMNVLTIDQAGGQMIYRLRVDRPEVQEWIKQFRG